MTCAFAINLNVKAKFLQDAEYRKQRSVTLSSDGRSTWMSSIDLQVVPVVAQLAPSCVFEIVREVCQTPA